MTKEALIEKIENLAPEKRAEVERFLEKLGRNEKVEELKPGSPDTLIERVRGRRERLFREHGLVDTSDILREIREEGG